MKKLICFIFIFCFSKWLVFPNEPLKVDVILEKKIIDKVNLQIGEGDYTRIVSDTVLTVLCYNYDTASIYRAYDRFYSLFFKEKNVNSFLQKRIFDVDEVALIDKLISMEFNNKRYKFGKEIAFYDYKLFSKSVYPYKDVNGNSILMVSGYIRYKGIKYSVFPILYDIAPDFFLAKINISKGELIFLR